VFFNITIHHEGYRILSFLAIFLLGLNILLWFYYGGQTFYTSAVLSAIAYLLVLQFFRSPDRIIPGEENAILSPADGNIVVLEKTREKEFFNDDRIQVSIFMSPVDVHLNRVPFSGKVVYQKYHKGKYLVAWHPKSSILNERNTLVLESNNGEKVLLRQIAGFVARRIVCYKNLNDPCKQGDEMGFIKFGSRLDLFLPPECQLNVEMNQKVKGGQSVIAYFKPESETLPKKRL
jgi:phosphatidylserine decarboxylase